MPCSDGSMSMRDGRTMATAELLKRVMVTNVSLLYIPEWVQRGDHNYMTTQQQADEVTRLMCDFCKEIGDAWIYDGRFRLNRDVANWWDDHKEQDAKREGAKP